MRAAIHHRIRLRGRLVEYRVVRSRAARKIRVRVGPSGVEVVQPSTHKGDELSEFLASHERWILREIDRAQRLLRVRRAVRRRVGEILYRGVPIGVRVESTSSRAAGNSVREVDGEIVVSRGAGSVTPPGRSLELWLRRQAREQIEKYLEIVTARLGQWPQRVYVMGQRTKWGNCSALRNLSFNWRLIQAPDFVLRYVVTHEAVHLAIPDHSARFWLAVQSLCRETERARQWLCRHQAHLQGDLAGIVEGTARSSS